MSFFRKRGARREEIRKNRPDSPTRRLAELRANGSITSLWVAAGFFLATTLVMMLREQVIPYRPGEFTPADITARVAFRFTDKDELAKAQMLAREIEPRVYSSNNTIKHIEELLVGLPPKVSKLKDDELPSPLKDVLDAGSLTKLQEFAIGPQYESYTDFVKSYIADLNRLGPIVLPEDQRHDELTRDLDRRIVIPGGTIKADSTYSNEHLESLAETLQTTSKKYFNATIAPKVVALTIRTLHDMPTHTLSVQDTIAAQNRAAQLVPASQGDIAFNERQPVVQRGEITTKGWQMLHAENEAYLAQQSGIWKTRAGTAASILILTIILASYVWRVQPRIIRNHARAIALAALMISMLLLAQIAGIGTSPTFVFGIAPTILVAVITTIAYEQRFAAGIASVHAVLVTMALNQSLSFFLVLWAGVVTCCYLLDEIRTRSKLIEVGGATAIALIFATSAAGLMQLLPPQYIFKNCLYSGAAGLGVGFVVLGILPFIEKAFKITTNMSLLELADASQPLLRRLALEAPGTYNHSLQVAALSEESAEAIGADPLLCRVGAYYHDIGKINKPEYFIENQERGHNLHMGINPTLSYKIIIGHVKDGSAMAKEYGLPTKLLLFIEQHHGTTLVEYFYHQACTSADAEGLKIAEHEFRYPGPKPKSKEIAIVMLADAVESATRAMSDPTPSRIESLVQELAMKRLLDGQFSECDLTMRELERVEKSLAKTLLSFYHGRIPYPSSAPASVPAANAHASVKSA